MAPLSAAARILGAVAATAAATAAVDESVAAAAAEPRHQGHGFKSSKQWMPREAAVGRGLLGNRGPRDALGPKFRPIPTEYTCQVEFVPHAC